MYVLLHFDRFILDKTSSVSNEVAIFGIDFIATMPPKKGKKTKAELEEEKLAREEEERKAKIAEDKKNAEDAEKRRLEQLRIESEHKNAREQELKRLQEEFEAITDELKSKELQLQAEEKREVTA